MKNIDKVLTNTQVLNSIEVQELQRILDRMIDAHHRHDRKDWLKWDFKYNRFATKLVSKYGL